MKVLVGNGNAMFVQGLVSDLEIKIQTHKFIFLVYLLPIVGADILLGSNWLASLGPHIMDYNSRTLEFFYNNELIILQGEKLLKLFQTFVSQLHRLFSTCAIASCFTIIMSQNPVSRDTHF